MRAPGFYSFCTVVVQPVCLDERRTGVNDDKRDVRKLALRLDH